MKDKKKIVIGLSCLLMVGTLCGVIGVNKTPSNQISSDITVQGKGIGFKLLAERNFKNGAFEKTISYSFNPDTITDKTVTMEVYYADEKEDCSEVLTADLNQEEQTIVITCYKDFSRVINLKLTSNMIPELTATLIIDYEKKVRKLTLTDRSCWGVGGNSDLESFKEGEFFECEYTTFTKDKNYTFELVNPRVVYADDIDFRGINELLEPDEYIGFNKLLVDKMCAFGELPTADELWNLYDNDDWRAFIYQTTIDNYGHPYFGIKYKISGTLRCVQNESWNVFYNEKEMFFMLGDYDFSNYIVTPDKLEFSESNIIF